jgi:biotin-(acetyl-CoA carboxylase) ligase
VSNQELILPPPFSLIALREVGDAFRHAQNIAAESGAGTIVWTRRFDIAEFAIVLEPDEPLRLSRRAIYICGNALADALSVHAPPEHPITLEWPDAIRVDDALVGGLQMAWPQSGEDDVPDWLVVGIMIRTVVMRAGEAGLQPLLGGLDEQGFEELSPATVIDGFSRYLLRAMDDWNTEGFSTVRRFWLDRAAKKTIRIADDGDLDGQAGSLRDALARPSWLDPETGAPWL